MIIMPKAAVRTGLLNIGHPFLVTHQLYRSSKNPSERILSLNRLSKSALGPLTWHFSLYCEARDSLLSLVTSAMRQYGVRTNNIIMVRSFRPPLSRFLGRRRFSLYLYLINSSFTFLSYAIWCADVRRRNRVVNSVRAGPVRTRRTLHLLKINVLSQDAGRLVALVVVRTAGVLHTRDLCPSVPPLRSFFPVVLYCRIVSRAKLAWKLLRELSQNPSANIAAVKVTPQRRATIVKNPRSRRPESLSASERQTNAVLQSKLITSFG